jgi:hypothetical protein
MYLPITYLFTYTILPTYYGTYVPTYYLPTYLIWYLSTYYLPT